MHIIVSWWCWTTCHKINYKKISKIQIQFVLPYLLDLSPIDYHLFEHPDNFLREKVFQIENEKFNESPAFLFLYELLQFLYERHWHVYVSRWISEMNWNEWSTRLTRLSRSTGCIQNLLDQIRSSKTFHLQQPDNHCLRSKEPYCSFLIAPC